MQRLIAVSDSLKDADAADAAADKRLKPEERIQIVLTLRNQRHLDASQQRLARVYRIIELQQS